MLLISILYSVGIRLFRFFQVSYIFINGMLNKFLFFFKLNSIYERGMMGIDESLNINFYVLLIKSSRVVVAFDCAYLLY